MKSQYLIWIIILLVYVVAMVIKRVYAASKTGDQGIAKRRPEWREKLDKFLSQARQELEIAKQEDSNKETGWEKISPQEEDDLKTIREEIPHQRTRQVLGKTPSPEIKPAVSGKEILSKDLEFGIQGLRKAVIWSEILAPPLALRDE